MQCSWIHAVINSAGSAAWGLEDDHPNKVFGRVPGILWPIEYFEITVDEETCSFCVCVFVFVCVFLKLWILSIHLLMDPDHRKQISLTLQSQGSHLPLFQCFCKFELVSN